MRDVSYCMYSTARMQHAVATRAIDREGRKLAGFRSGASKLCPVVFYTMYTHCLARFVFFRSGASKLGPVVFYTM